MLKKSLPNGLEFKCKLGISPVYRVICKPSGYIYLERLPTDEQHFNAELVYKKQKNTDDTLMT